MQDLLSIGTNRRESMIGTGIGLGLAGYRLRTSFEAMPSLDLQFADRRMIQAVLGPTPSFSRASTGTFFNSQGVLTSAAVNGPRFNHTYNGTSWVSRGLLVEEQRTNLLISSEDFNTNWVKNGAGGITVATNTDIAPDGTVTADTITATPVIGGAEIRTIDIPVTAGAYTFSVFIKKTVGATVFPIIYPYSSAGDFGIFVNTNTGQLANYAGVVTGKTTTDCGSYWRISVSGTISSSVNLRCYIFPSGTNDMANFNPSLTASQVYWGAQFEAGSFATSYLKTISSSVTRSADVCQITGSDFSGFYNQNEGSVVLEFDGAQPLPSPSPRNFPAYLSISKGNSGYDLETNSFSIFGNSDTNKIGAYASIDRVTQYEIYSTGLFSPNLPQRSSFGYAVNNFGFTNNGENVLTDTSGTNPNQMAYLHLGKSSGGTFSCHIARLRYYPVRLSNSKLQELST